jgi:hypothetical protein
MLSRALFGQWYHTFHMLYSLEVYQILGLHVTTWTVSNNTEVRSADSFGCAVDCQHITTRSAATAQYSRRQITVPVHTCDCRMRQPQNKTNRARTGVFQLLLILIPIFTFRSYFSITTDYQTP